MKKLINDPKNVVTEAVEGFADAHADAALNRGVLHLRREHKEAVGLDDFLALGLIAGSYGVALLAHTYGFLAVFAAGLALRRVERQASLGKSPSTEVEAAAL